MQYPHRDLVGRDLFERADDRLERALHVGFDDDRQLLGGAGGDLREHLLERAAPAGRGGWSRRRRWRKSVISRARLSFSTTTKSSPASGRPLRPSTSIGVEGPASSWYWPRSSTSARTRPHSPPVTKMSPISSVPRCTSTVATGPRPRSSLASSTTPSAVRFGLACRSSSSACSRIASCKLVEIGLLQRRHLDVEHLAAELLDDDLVLQQFLAHPVGSGVGPVDLVDRDDDRHLRRLGVADRLDGLLHDAVIGGDDQHDDVGDVGAARPHRGEGLVARRVDEGDLLAAFERHPVGADMLGDAARLAGRDIGLAQRVEQRGLAVVDMAHDRDDRGARLQHVGLVGLAAHADLDVGFGDAAHPVAEFGDDQLGGVGVDRLVDRRHHAHAHQRLDHVGAALGHAVGQFLDRDRLGDDDVAHDLRLLAGCACAGARARGRGGPRRASASARRRRRRARGSRSACRGGAGRRRAAPGWPAASNPGGGRGAPQRRRFLLFLGRRRHLAGGGQRGDLGGRGLAGALGDLAAGFFLLAAGLFVRRRASSPPPRRCLFASSSSTRRRASSSALRAPRSAARSSSWRRRSASASAARRRESSSALRASCRTRTRVACSSAVSVRAGRPGGGRPAPRADGAAGCGAAGLGAGSRSAAAGSPRPGSAAPGATTRFLRTSTVTAFERPCEKLWRTWPVSTGRRSPSVPPERSVKALLLLLVGVLFVRFSHALRYRPSLPPELPA